MALSNFLSKLKDKSGWNSWEKWHPHSQRIVKIFPLLLLVLAIPLTVKVAQENQNFFQEAAHRCRGNNSYCNLGGPTPTPVVYNSPTPTSAPGPTGSTQSPTPTATRQKIVTVNPSTSISQFLSLTRDMTVDVIEMAGGNYNWDNVQIDIDRTNRPLTIKPASGAKVIFIGNGKTSAGVFFFGYNGPTKWITMDGITPDGFTFSGIALAQAGIFELRSSDHLTLKNMTFNNLSRDPIWSDKPYKTWAAYISTAGGRNNEHLLIDHWNLLPPAVYRDVSGIQVASSSVADGSVAITNITVSKYAYAFYDEVPTANLLLDTWSITDSGNHTTPASVSFTNVSINGTYKNLHATLSDPLKNTSTGSMVNGGGNSGL